MSQSSGVTADSLQKGLLMGLIGPGRPFAGLDPEVLEDAILDAEAEVEQDLSIRFAVTEFRGFLGVGTPPRAAGIEEEGPYEWPGSQPGDRFPVFRLRVRPVVELLEVKVSFPGGITAPISLGLDWFRVDHDLGEVTLAPQGATAPLFAAGLCAPFVGLTGRQLPDSVLISYRAGLGPDGLLRFRKIKRLVALRAALHVLPTLSAIANPTALSSQSADGLSETRSSGYIFKDLEDRLRMEADEAMDHLRGLLEGPSLSVL